MPTVDGEQEGIDPPNVVTKPLRLGIVGCGAVAQLCHLRALAALPQYEVVVLCDRKDEIALAAKLKFGLRAATTTRLEDLAGRVDAAIVCVWPRDHLQVTRELLASGIDVLCEKPVATCAADATIMADLAEQSGRIVAVGQWCRCLKSSWLLRRLLALGILGDIVEISAAFGSVLGWPMSSDAYFDRRLTPGGVMYDAGIHAVDLVVWLFGEISRIGFQDDALGGVEANGILRGVIEIDGRPVPCRIDASWTHDLGNRVRVVGTRGEAEATFGRSDDVSLGLSAAGDRINMQVPPDGLDTPFTSSNPYAAQLENFALAVQTRGQPVTPVRSTLLPLRIIETAYAIREPLEQPWVTSRAPFR